MSYDLRAGLCFQNGGSSKTHNPRLCIRYLQRMDGEERRERGGGVREGEGGGTVDVM